MKLILTFVVLLFFLNGFSQSKPKENGDLVVAGSVYNFGKIPKDVLATHTFSVVNKSKNSLQIDSVGTRCGCTIPEWEKGKTLSQDEFTDVKVGYTAKLVGQFLKTIIIYYNGTHKKELTIVGEVIEK